MKIPFLCYVAIFLPVATEGQQLSPTQIHDRFMIACQTLNFSDVSPYIHTCALVTYRKTTSAVIKHAVEKYGADAVLEFFQGTTLQDLQAFSDQKYWAFVMASSLQFTTEKPMLTIAPRAEFKEANRLFLVYPATRSLITAPELGSFLTHVTYGFEQEGGSWKMITFFSTKFEEAFCSYLSGKPSVKHS